MNGQRLPALILDAETLDPDRLSERISARAAALRCGRVTVRAVSDPLAAVIDLFAAPLSGRAFLPLDPALPAARRECLELDWGEAAPAPLASDAVRLIVATSGSDGAPKGVMLTGANLEAAAAASRARLGLGTEDVWLCCLPLFHVGGLMIPLRCAEAGAAVRLHARFDAEAVWRDVASGGVTHISLVPAMLARLLDVSNARPPETLKRVLVGGAALSSEVAERARAAGWPLAPTYGMTETASQTATLADPTGDWQAGCVGTPLDGLEVALREDGRIRVRGPMVMAGYLNRDLEPGDGLDPDGWFTTGDRGGWDDDGRLVVLGRADDMLVTGGETLHPAEIEAALSRCPGVTEVWVTGRPDPVWGDRLVAVVTGNARLDDVEAWCRAHLDGPRRPREIRVVAELPRTALGKRDRAALRRLAEG